MNSVSPPECSRGRYALSLEAKCASLHSNVVSCKRDKMQIEDLTAVLYDSHDFFFNIWLDWIVYVQTLEYKKMVIL